MKALLIYPAMREQPCVLLPQGLLLIRHALKIKGLDVKILNLDVKRLEETEILKEINSFLPDIIGLSAVTSTTYSFVKKTVASIKINIKKNIYIIVGGNLVANSSLLLENCGVDICFIGESYFSIQAFIDSFEIYKKKVVINYEKLKEIRGIVFKYNNKQVFTGRRKQENLNNIPFIKDLEGINKEFYFPYVRDMQITGYPEHIQKKIKSLPLNSKSTAIMLGSGCQNICSFCHRNVKGVRIRSIEKIFEYIDFLIEKYDVRLFYITDESFLINERWLNDFAEEVALRNILFRLGGARVDKIIEFKGILKRLVNSGLIEINVGLESGSEKILEIMDKNISIKQNYTAIKILNELNIRHCPQIIIGMPGDGPRHIKATLKMLKTVTTSKNIYSINYAQVLPGTPLYWFAIYNHIITNEESYLLKISDRNAYDLHGTVNVTEYPVEIFLIGRQKIIFAGNLRSKKYCLSLKIVLSMIKQIFLILVNPRKSVKVKISILFYFLFGIGIKTNKIAFDYSSLRTYMLRCEGDKMKNDPLDKLKYGIL